MPQLLARVEILMNKMYFFPFICNLFKLIRVFRDFQTVIHNFLFHWGTKEVHFLRINLLQLKVGCLCEIKLIHQMVIFLLILTSGSNKSGGCCIMELLH